jgi:hypothetical protein
VSESGNHLVSFSNLIVFTMSFALTDHYGKPNFMKKPFGHNVSDSAVAAAATI